MTAARTDGGAERKPGDRIARKLELVRRLAEGGMGELWVARNLNTQAEVAIKLLRPHRADDDHAAERFRHEAELGAKLTHRNVTRVFDLLVDEDGALVLVMELLHGRTLEAAYKEKGTLGCREAVEIIVPVLGALQHAHDRGVIHRDVKPSNIFLDVDPDGHTTPKLLDFGIAKTHDFSALTHTGEALGSPRYMSPEQVRASKQLDGRSDLFSIGVVLYEIITGENPFDAPSPTAALAQVLELEVDPHPKIEPRLWLEIQRALAKQPYERHATANELSEALCRAVEIAAPESLRHPGPSTASATLDADTAPMPSVLPGAREPEIARPVPFRRGVLALGTAAIALVAVLGFVLFGRGTPPEPAAAAQTEAGPASAAANAPADDAPPTVGDLDTPPTTAPRATRGVPRRRQFALPAASRPSPGAAAAGAKAPGPGSATPAPSIARTPGF